MLTIEAKPVSCTHTAMEDFWAREDIILVVPGSLPCIRGVYLRARGRRKIESVCICPHGGNGLCDGHSRRPYP